MPNEQAIENHKTEHPEQVNMGTNVIGELGGSCLETSKANQTSVETEKQRTTSTPWPKRLEPSVILSSVTAILTALMVITLIYHGLQFERQWNAMRDSISETKRSRELEYRAYVGVKSVYISPQFSNAAEGKAMIVYSNTGRTPAFNTTIRVDHSMRETPIPEDTSFPAADIQLSKAIMMPLTDMFVDAGVIPIMVVATGPVTTPAVPKIIQTEPFPSSSPTATNKMFKGQWYVYGVIEYDDIFGQHHRTKFCSYNVWGQSVFFPCPGYNTFT
jgi:hypothetical protein